MDDDSDTNFGWWTDKPDRPRRPALYRARRSFDRRRGASVWTHAALVVALMVAFSWSLKVLAVW